jgi:hypothetical protein
MAGLAEPHPTSEHNPAMSSLLDRPGLGGR